jgi:hypothetical protein
MRRWGPEKWLLVVTFFLILVTASLALIGWIGNQSVFYRYAFRCAVMTICVWTVPFLVAMLYVFFDNIRTKRD